MNYKQVDIEQITLDKFVEINNFDTIDLLKIDVEPYELEVFKGAKNILTKFSPVIFVELYVDDERKNFYDEFLKPLGYYCYLILESGLIRTGKLINNPDCRNFILSKGKSLNQYISYKEGDIIINELKPTSDINV